MIPSQAKHIEHEVAHEVVKKIIRRRAVETKLAGPGKMIARSTA